MWDLLHDDFTISKRQLGVLLLIGGVIVLAAMIAAEVLSTGPGGIGTMQKLGIAVGAVSMVIGLTLLPLGSRPA